MLNLNPTLKYPPFSVRIKQQSGQTQIFDVIRKKWLVLTPEEWVRQHVINYLVVIKKYPAGSIAIEKELNLNGTKKRFDILIYDHQLKPFLIVECKAPYIALDQLVIDQAQRYNLIFSAPFLMITNGISDFVFNSNNQFIELPDRTHVSL